MESESFDSRSHARNALTRHIFQDKLFRCESSLSLKMMRFSDLEFAADILILNIKYNHFEFQNNNPFYLFHN